RLPVGIREDWGRLLLDMLDEVAQAPDGHVQWRSRRQLHEDDGAYRQMLFTCATRSGKDVEASFGSYMMLRHHQVGKRTGHSDTLTSIGVMLTPSVSRRRPWETMLVRVEGPSGLTPDDLSDFEELWPEGAGI
ncbi:hypothetical protein, partial [Streptomyces sp. NPDC060188]|uniref:hypothetical protein n=1 Tax=Streptomyces sp. NPDC060188 TaxID=3347068 RepID=UPI003654935F